MMQITEPVTMITDYALAAVSFAYAWQTARRIGPHNRVSGWFWSAAFAATGIAAALGGTYHGFTNHMDEGTRRTLWNLTVYALGACGAFITAGVHAAHLRREDGTVKWLIIGLSITGAGALVQQTGFRRGLDFNHNDVYHVIQIGGLYFLHRCAATIRDRPGVTT
jgi:hypothetical protein